MQLTKQKDDHLLVDQASAQVVVVKPLEIRNQMSSLTARSALAVLIDDLVTLERRV